MRSTTATVMLVLAAILTVAPATCWGQVTTATFYGIVTDPSGAVVPGAEARLTHEATGTSRAAITGDTGEFVIDFLPVGFYTLRIEMPGFKAAVVTRIELAAGQVTRKTYLLEVGEVSEAVTVQSDASQINTVSTEQRESIGALQIGQLPLGRRNVTNILRLTTGVDVAGGTRGVRINGVGKHGTGITVDGTDANSNPEGRGISQYGGTNYIDVMSIEAVQEVQVMRGILAAEHGGVVGGQVNLISRSGTNNWHGSLFHLYQSHLFNARQPFVARLRADGSEIPKPRVVYNQFGGSAGGPVIRDRVFIFGAYEGYRESSFNPVSGTVPTQKFRDEILKALAFPETKIVLDTLPLPTEPHPTNPDLGFFLGARNRAARENHVILKGDVNGLLRQGSNLAVTFSRNRPRFLEPRFNTNGANDRLYENNQDRLTFQFVTGGSHWTSESRVGYNRVDMQRLDLFFEVKDPKSKEESIWGRRMGQISVSGLFSTPGSETWDMEGPTYSVDQKIARNIGQHLFKVGGRYVFYGGSRSNPENPVFSFQTKADLLANIPTAVTPTFGAPAHKSRMYELGFFAQDDWRLSPRLVINLGLRYDFYSNSVVEPITPVPAAIVNLTPPTDWARFNFGPPRDGKNPYEHDGWANLGPRLGFAYNPDGKGKTVIRSGYGVLFSPQIPAVVRQGAAHPIIPFRIRWSKVEAGTLGLKWPLYNDEMRKIAQTVIAQSGTLFLFSALNPELQNPYSMNYQLNVQRAITSTLMLETGYVGVRGVKFILQRVPNQPDRDTGLRPNPKLNFGGYYVDNSQNSLYSAWQTSLRKRFSSDFSFDVHYTWSKGLAVTGGDIGAYYQGDADINIQEFHNPRADRGPTSGDARHRFIADWIYELPQFGGANAVVRQILGGWQVTGILSARSGEPLAITQSSATRHARPDYIGGDPVLDNWKSNALTTRCVPGAHCPLQYLNVNAFARVAIDPESRETVRPGTAGLGLVRNPSTWSMDVAMGKEFRLREGMRLNFRLDMFNSLNHVNYGGPTTSINSGFFGQIRGAGGMRSMQFGTRLTF